jgi:hypothetical protein
MGRWEESMIKTAAFAVAGAILAAAPASAMTTAGRAAPVHSGFLTIAGPKRLQPARELRIPIRCSTDCDVKAFTRLRTPSDRIGPEKAIGHLKPNVTRNLIVTLNAAAAKDVEEHYSGSMLRVRVSAVSSVTGEEVHALKVFDFEGPAPQPVG